MPKHFFLTSVLLLFLQQGWSQSHSYASLQSIDTPVVFRPGVICNDNLFEGGCSFSPDGKRILFTAYNNKNWNAQTIFEASFDGTDWSTPEIFSKAGHVYNAALSQDGQELIFCKKRKGVKHLEVWLSKLGPDGWQVPENLSELFGIRGGYFCLQPDGMLYFFSKNWDDPEDKGDIYFSRRIGSRYTKPEKLGTGINTPDGTEFSPYVDREQRFMIFTRYVEGKPHQQGFFISYRKYDQWVPAVKIEKLPYGWGATVTPDNQYLLYTDGKDIYQVSLSSLGLEIELYNN